MLSSNGWRLVFVLLILAAGSGPAIANHPVLVEGTCLGPGAAQRTIVPPGTCGDYDGDGRIGVAEDNDEADRVFGTINAALGPGIAGTGANQNGNVTIVASGVFPETVVITAANGNVTLQAAPGVEAIIDAIVQGVPGGAARQEAPGIIVNAPADRYVVLRNVVSRNWAVGIEVQGDSHVLIEDSRLENNSNRGIHVQDSAEVAITETRVAATGRRVGAGTDFPRVNPPMPGTGVEFDDNSSGIVSFTTVTGSVRAGISRQSNAEVCVHHVTVFDNNPNFQRVREGDGECKGKSARKDKDD